jgi:hypothetical protein
MATTAKPQIPNGFDKAFRAFPERSGPTAVWIGRALLAAWQDARAAAGRLFQATVPIDGTVPPGDHPVLSFSVPRDAPPD